MFNFFHVLTHFIIGDIGVWDMVMKNKPARYKDQSQTDWNRWHFVMLVNSVLYTQGAWFTQGKDIFKS